jgi:Mg-chelatase subunit ChlD
VVKIIVEAFNVNGEPLDTLPPETINVVENGIERKIVSVEKISIKERVPVDFVFVIDRTGSMQNYIDQTKRNIVHFTNSLQSRGIDYRIGLVLFSDYIDRIFQPTSDLSRFLSWLDGTKAEGGGDFKENALEALARVASMDFRPSANRG